MFTILTDELKLFNFLKKKFFYTDFYNKKNLILIRKINNNWIIKYKKRKIEFRSNNNENELSFISWIIRFIIQRDLLIRRIIFLHCSAIIYKNQLLVFLGKSGAGKSTIYNNFPKKSRFTNDILIIKIDESNTIGYFSPFEKEILINKKKLFYKVRSLFLLKKDNYLKIKNINQKKLINLFLEDNFLNVFFKKDKKITIIEKQMFLRLIVNFLKTVSFFQLNFSKGFNYQDFFKLYEKKQN